MDYILLISKGGRHMSSPFWPGSIGSQWTVYLFCGHMQGPHKHICFAYGYTIPGSISDYHCYIFQTVQNNMCTKFYMLFMNVTLCRNDISKVYNVFHDVYVYESVWK